jgi:hypothetical protein
VRVPVHGAGDDLPAADQTPPPTSTPPFPVVLGDDATRLRPHRRRRRLDRLTVLILAIVLVVAATALYVAFGRGPTRVALDHAGRPVVVLPGALDPAQEAVRRYVEDPEVIDPRDVRWVRWWPSRRPRPADAERWKADTVVLATVEYGARASHPWRLTLLYLLKGGRVAAFYDPFDRKRVTDGTDTFAEVNRLANAYFPPDR